MRKLPLRFGFFAAILFTGGLAAYLCFADTSTPEQPKQPEGTKLVVLVVFDQMSASYLTKWEKYYDKDGMGRLLRDGAWYQNCHYPYAYTLTAPGHASIATGCSPDKHGIVGNDWYDRVSRAVVSPVSTERYRTLPLAKDAKKDADEGTAPVRLKQSTVGDSLQKMHKGKAKVVSLSIKDRSAILLAGLRAAIVYWFNSARGMFSTSTFYSSSLHPWVDDFNKQKPADKYFGKDWTKLRPDIAYEKLTGPDSVAVEGSGYKQGRTFPHPTTGGLAKPGRAYYDAVTHSPFGNDMLLDLTKRAIDAEKLGQRDACDLLFVSFSCNDLVGHTWGPDSQEVLDVTLRSDLVVKELLNYLDAKVGKDRYVLLLTADHGVMPIPEVAKSQGKEGGRVPPNTFTTKVNAHLQKTFADGKKSLQWVEKWSAEWIYFNYAVLKEAGVPPAKAEQAVAEWLRQQPGIQNAYTRTQVSQKGTNKDPIEEAVRKSFHPDCSGDVAVVLRPNHMVSQPIQDGRNESFRTTHGSPHEYDTHVPLLVFGAGVKSGVRNERVTPLAAAAIMAQALSVPAPDGAEYPVPEGLFK